MAYANLILPEGHGMQGEDGVIVSDTAGFHSLFVDLYSGLN